MTSLVDLVINQILASRGCLDVHLSPSTILFIADKVFPELARDSTLLKLKPPINIVGDLHGSLIDLLRVFQTAGMPPYKKFLFLGDYVDRGTQSIEVITLLYALKVKFPDHVFLLRGNHECSIQNEVGGFLAECNSKANRQVWVKINETFKYLPLAATVGDKIFCVHGGISPGLTDINQIKSIMRPVSVPIKGLITDLLWSDPDDSTLNWERSGRGETYIYGRMAVKKFLETHNMKLIVRGHQLVENGYQFPFFGAHTVMTLHSQSKIIYPQVFRAAMMKVKRNLKCNIYDLATSQVIAKVKVMDIVVSEKDLPDAQPGATNYYSSLPRPIGLTF